MERLLILRGANIVLALSFYEVYAGLRLIFVRFCCLMWVYKHIFKIWSVLRAYAPIIVLFFFYMQFRHQGKHFVETAPIIAGFFEELLTRDPDSDTRVSEDSQNARPKKSSGTCPVCCKDPTDFPCGRIPKSPVARGIRPGTHCGLQPWIRKLKNSVFSGSEDQGALPQGCEMNPFLFGFSALGSTYCGSFIDFKNVQACAGAVVTKKKWYVWVGHKLLMRT